MKITAQWLHHSATRRVCDALEAGGAQALFVGGCVRNSLIGAPVSDLDMCSDALPEQVSALAGAAGLKVIPTGIEHGTVTVVCEGVPFEITTFRRDDETDGRHATVSFTTDIAQDAARRDFTMNALYARPDGTVLDPLGLGIADAQARHLRFVGEPAARIAEDYLRILRYFRFYAWYADPERGADPEALAAIAHGAEGLSRVSRERIGAEMRKLLAAADPGPALAMMQASGVLAQVLPGADAKAVPVLVHLEGETGLPPLWTTRLAVLGGAEPGPLLRLSRAEVKGLADLTVAQSMGHAEAAYRYGADLAEQSVLALGAVLGQAPQPGWQGAVALGAASVFPIRAADLAGQFQGPALGQTLREREAAWIASGFTLDRAALLSR